MDKLNIALNSIRTWITTLNFLKNKDNSEKITRNTEHECSFEIKLLFFRYHWREHGIEESEKEKKKTPESIPVSNPN